MRPAVLAVLSLLVAAPAAAETLPLPPELIALATPEGEALLIGAEARGDYFPLSIHFTTQINPAFCGPASMAMVLNALGVPRPASDLPLGLGMFDQANVFTPATEAVKPQASILRGGMTLEQLGGMLATYGLTVDVHHAADSSLEAFRKSAVEALGDDGRFLLVNYLRKTMGQEAGGHISPVAAYDAETDRFLILDVSRYKYPPVWVTASALFAAMDTEDSDAGNKTRGYLFVSR